MTDIARQDNVATWIAALDARVKKLESFPPGAVTLITRHPFTGSNHAASSTWADIAESRTASFTLIRPQPVFVVATINASGPTSSAQSLALRACLSTGANQGPANDVNGAAMAAYGAADAYTTANTATEQCITTGYVVHAPGGNVHRAVPIPVEHRRPVQHRPDVRRRDRLVPSERLAVQYRELDRILRPAHANPPPGISRLHYERALRFLQGSMRGVEPDAETRRAIEAIRAERRGRR